MDFLARTGDLQLQLQLQLKLQLKWKWKLVNRQLYIVVKPVQLFHINCIGLRGRRVVRPQKAGESKSVALLKIVVIIWLITNTSTKISAAFGGLKS